MTTLPTIVLILTALVLALTLSVVAVIDTEATRLWGMIS